MTNTPRGTGSSNGSQPSASPKQTPPISYTAVAAFGLAGLAVASAFWLGDVPVLAIVLSLAAVILGFISRKALQRDESLRGATISVSAVIIGGIILLAQVTPWIMLGISQTLYPLTH
ncbi:hypothetical protein [Lysinibacter cavernae]|uniref:Uncharacterized membrane protein YhaH (DUF805 family) n=1 Tax=Lysinibacter cavernae TaxID=1640652 RepID=A0A7X5QZP3_9MICO|nr:hypothetical protein [Lysinibacter cavernae]NIH52901.1 uncharacterized membrane protein YhaH (DUF805 family) [Lysinibacter cavernae]